MARTWPPNHRPRWASLWTVSWRRRRHSSTCFSITCTGLILTVRTFTIIFRWLSSLFCRTGLPLARTRWARSTFLGHCPDFFGNAIDFLFGSSAIHFLSNIFSLSTALVISIVRKFRKYRDSNPERLSEKCKCYLCAMPSPQVAHVINMTPKMA